MPRPSQYEASEDQQNDENVGASARIDNVVRQAGAMSASVEETQSCKPAHSIDGGPVRLLPSPRLGCLPHDASLRSTSAPAPGDAGTLRSFFDSDLGIDLPSDLAQAIRTSVRRHTSQVPKSSDNSVSTHDNADITKEDTKGAEGVNQQRNRQVLADLLQPETILRNSRHDNAEHSRQATDEKATESDNDSISSEANNSSEANSIVFSELTRAQLEMRLARANKVIRERERDLGIAAAVGQALLEKNMSLRDKHSEVASRSLVSLDSVERMIDQQIPAFTAPLPRYSPPHSDFQGHLEYAKYGTNDNEDDDNDEDKTPRVQYPTYFSGPPSGSVVAHFQSNAHNSAIDRESQHVDAYEHYVSSRPASPLQNAFGTMIPSETRRQLHLIYEQNDDLLEQISQLQSENEDAKRDGGKRLKKLMREIDSLRFELEAAEARNSQLEHEASTQADFSLNSRNEKHVLSQNHLNSEENDESTPNSVPDAGPAPFPPIEEQAAVESNRAEDDTARYSHQRQSTVSSIRSSHSRPGSAQSHRTVTESERLLIEQLLRKVHELEEMNVALTLEANERDGRIGLFMQEGERIKDLYEAVESEVASDYDGSTMGMGSMSYGDMSYAFQSPAASSPASSPFATRRRRAPGNRHLIQGRRTLMDVMRSPSADEVATKTRRDRSASSSSSRHPRIFVTPSVEDLRAKMTQQNDANSSLLSAVHAEGCSEHENHRDRETNYPNSSPLRATSQGRRQPPITPPNSSALMRTLQSEMVEAESSFSSAHENSAASHYRSPSAHSGGRARQSRLQRLSSHGSIRSIAESDIADVPAPSSKKTLLAPLTAGNHNVISPRSKSGVEALITRSGDALDPVHHADGEWYSGFESRAVPLRSLRDGKQTSYDAYDRLERVTAHVPVHWADDDDFGKPITERSARKLGLLDAPKQVIKAASSSGLLGWIRPQSRKMERQAESKHKTKSKVIESVEDIKRREEMEALLRSKRQMALQSRVQHGQLTSNEAWRRGAFDGSDMGYPGYDDDEEGLYWRRNQGLIDEHAFEAEITKRAFAYRTAGRCTRQGHRDKGGHLHSPASQGRGTAQTMRAKKAISDRKDDEEDFELVDLDATKRRRGRRGTDYYPVTLRERYHPAIVRQRMHQLSAETLTWVAAWAAFSVVMVLAFIATFARGPRRVLHGRHD